MFTKSSIQESTSMERKKCTEMGIRQLDVSTKMKFLTMPVNHRLADGTSNESKGITSNYSSAKHLRTYTEMIEEKANRLITRKSRIRVGRGMVYASRDSREVTKWAVSDGGRSGGLASVTGKTKATRCWK